MRNRNYRNNFKFEKTLNVSIEEMNRIIANADKYTNVVVGLTYHEKFNVPEHRSHSLATHSFLKSKEVRVEITTKYGNDKMEPCTYQCRLDGEIDTNVSGLQAYRVLRKYYKEALVADFPELEAKMPKAKLTGTNKYVYSAGPAVDFNPKYDNTRHPVYIYDLNSAYAMQMMDQIPDISTYRFYDKVKEGEVGFLLQEGLPMVPLGYQGDVVMKLIDSPYKEFASTYYKRKKEASERVKYATSEEEREQARVEKEKAKCILNYSVGYLQMKNPFIRAWIVNNCNRYIESIIDENTCLWNTDAIYSLEPRYDLDIGDEIGQFKVEFYKEFAQKGNNYQKDWEPPHYRGINRKWFGKRFDLLVDELPTCEQNIYYLKGKKIVKKKKAVTNNAIQTAEK